MFSCENAKDLWKTISENHEGTKDVVNERYHVLIDKLNSFKQLDDENAESMYSRLNVLVDEINSLEVKKIDDLELIRKILHSLRRPEYDLVTTILYEKELSTMTPNEVLNKVTAHELRNDIKPRVPPSSPTHSALISKQERLLKKMAIKRSSSEEKEENESQCSSSDEGVMPPQALQASEDHEQKLEEDQFDGVRGLPQRWASLSTHEG